MPAYFPTPFGGSAALYPLMTAKRYPVTILEFSDKTEQRFVQSAGISKFTLTLSEITKAEKDDIVDFFEGVKGDFDATWSLVLGTDTYDYMAFGSDKLTTTETSNGVWSVVVQLVQTRKN